MKQGKSKGGTVTTAKNSLHLVPGDPLKLNRMGRK